MREAEVWGTQRVCWGRVRATGVPGKSQPRGPFSLPRASTPSSRGPPRPVPPSQRGSSPTPEFLELPGTGTPRDPSATDSGARKGCWESWFCPRTTQGMTGAVVQHDGCWGRVVRSRQARRLTARAGLHFPRGSAVGPASGPGRLGGTGGTGAGRGGGAGPGSSPRLGRDRLGGRTWVGAWATPRAGSRVLDVDQMPSAGLGPGWARDAGPSRAPGTCGSWR